VSAPTGSLTGWPFLVARGRRVGYRSLLLPPGLADRGGLLADALSGEGLGPGSVRTRTVDVPDVGPLVCTYRVERLDGGSGLGEPSQLRDEHGRPLEILYGVACVTPAEVHVDHRDLDVARTAALSTYERLLADETAFRPEESHPVPLRSTRAPRIAEPVLTDGQPVAVTAPKPAAAAPSPPAAAARAGRPAWVLPAAAGLVVVLVAAVVWKMLLAPSNDVLTVVTASAAPYGATTCDAQATVLLSGVLAAAHDADVAYHWRDAGTGWRTGSRQVRVHAGRATTVSATMPVQVSAGQTTRGTVSLVVESPDQRTAKASYAVDCSGG
jgi:hypothetical protein